MITVLGITSLLMLLFVLLIWIGYLVSHNPSIVDGCWSIGILLCSSAYFFLQSDWQFQSTRNQITWIILLAWAIRLSGYLWLTRIAKKHHDPRYESISEGWKISKHIGFLLNYLLQGFLMMLVALPFMFIATNASQRFSIIDCIALFIIIMAFIGESLADWQLYQFKQKTTKMVCDVGLWHYSRHPNYFFESLIWLGFSLIGLGSQYGYFSLISPLFLIGIFVFITGPITERQSLKSRGEAFMRYQQTTSFIIPWFKKS